MEPRPPRPRSPHPFDTPGPPATTGVGDRLDPAPGEPAFYAEAETYAPGVAAAPLRPRRQRRQRGALRGIAVTIVAIALLAALGWFFRDAVRGFISPPASSPTPALAVAPGTPTAAPESAALPNALATVTPTAVAVTATPNTRATAAPASDEETGDIAVDEAATGRDRDISPQTMTLLEFLPATSNLPPGMKLADEAERSKAEVIESLGGTDEAAQFIEEWGWSGNAFRDFISDPDAEVPSTTQFLNVSVHRFADAASAANALVFFSDQVIFVPGLQEVEAPALGESARLLVGAPEGYQLSVLYAQDGPILYRIGGSSGSAEIDPSPDVLAVAAAIIPGQGTADGG